MSEFSEFRSAIRKEDLDQVKRIFKKDYINFTDDMGWTPLHWACGYNKNINIVRFLIDEGSNIEAETSNAKWRPIHLAVFNGYAEIVRELLNRGCLMEVLTERGESPLDVAVEWKKDDCVEILKRHRRYSQSEVLDQVSSSPSRTNLTLPTIKSSQNLQDPSLVDFKKGNLLGRGGFGQVYKCFDQETGRDFAMKEVLLGPINTANKDIHYLENEISIYKSLMSHPRIVKYFGTSQDQNAMYIFMEYMTGGSIKDHLVQYGPLQPNIIARYVKQILEGLAFLHHKMIIHRDIKASNILRDVDGNVKLSDFGTSKFLEKISLYSISRGPNMTITKGKDSGMNSTDSFCGTFYWMAPEVIRGEHYNISADVWSLGATVVEMLTGNPPYHELEPCAALFKIGNTKKVEYQSPQIISKEFQTFINKMFVPNQQKRANVSSLLKSSFILKVQD